MFLTLSFDINKGCNINVENTHKHHGLFIRLVLFYEEKSLCD
jgi:hypothetical protein